MSCEFSLCSLCRCFLTFIRWVYKVRKGNHPLTFHLLFLLGSWGGWTCGEGRVPYVRVCGFGALLKGTSTVRWRCSGTFQNTMFLFTLGIEPTPLRYQCPPHFNHSAILIFPSRLLEDGCLNLVCSNEIPQLQLSVYRQQKGYVKSIFLRMSSAPSVK